MEETFGSTCHGAGRARSRNSSRNKLDYQQVLDALKTKGIAIRWAACGGLWGGSRLVGRHGSSQLQVTWPAG
jgi:hypothetical protein